MFQSNQVPPTEEGNSEGTMGGCAVRFNKFNVSNGAVKARVFYSTDNRTDGRTCVTIYAKDYGHKLRAILGTSYSNATDTDSDLFDEGKAVLFEDHPLYAAARKRAEA